MGASLRPGDPAIRRSGAASILWSCHNRTMRSRAFNIRQRVVVVIGFGAGLFFFGGWLTTRGEGGSGWVSYAPLTAAGPAGYSGPGLHPWVRLLIWLALIVVWIIVGVVLLRSRPVDESSGSAD